MGRLFGFGREPVRMAGTAPTVSQKTVEALRYQVASRASAAKFGNRPASIRPLRFIRVVVLSSSKTTTTTGVLEPTVAGECLALRERVQHDDGAQARDEQEVQRPR